MENRELQSDKNKKSSRPKEKQTSFDSENKESEINPEKLEREEMEVDRSGSDNSKGHEPYEFKIKQDKDHLIGQGGYGSET